MSIYRSPFDTLQHQTRTTCEQVVQIFETNQNVKSKYDIILLGFSLNEINQDQESFQCVEWIQELSHSLKGSGRLVITEPAEVETCRNLQSIMSIVAEQNPNLFLQAPF